MGDDDMLLCPVPQENEQAKLLSQFELAALFSQSNHLSLSLSDAGCLFEDGVCESYEVCANGK